MPSDIGNPLDSHVSVGEESHKELLKWMLAHWPDEGVAGPPSGGSGGSGGTILLPNIAAPIDPRLMRDQVGLGVGGYILGARLVIPTTGTLHDLAILVTLGSAGTVDAGLYSAAATRSKLWSTGAIACPPNGVWTILGNPSMAVTEGQQLDFALTATAGPGFVGMSLNAFAETQLPAGFQMGQGALAKTGWYTPNPDGTGTTLPVSLAEVDLSNAGMILGVIGWIEPSVAPGVSVSGIVGPMGMPGPEGEAGESWMIPGPPGPTSPGTPGSPGPAGPAGVGVPGMDGEDGAEPLMIPGAAGKDGAAGTPGSPGAPGAPGPAGAPGPWGADGEDGIDFIVPGPAGVQGIQGIQGIQGNPGNAGAAGAAGAPGPWGADGEDGIDFIAPGPVGAKGDQGIQGNPGNAGAAGPAGQPGAPGFDGEEGETWMIPGPAGSKGDAGAGGGGGGKGTVTLDFGAWPGTGSAFTFVADATVGATSRGQAFWIVVNSPDHTWEEHLLSAPDIGLGVEMSVGSGLGFYAFDLSRGNQRLYGKYTVGYTWV